jgi:transposase
MSQSTVVSAKISKRLKNELEKSGINVSAAIRSGLENALLEKKIEHLQALLREVDSSKLTKEQIVKDIRRGRERVVAEPDLRQKAQKRTG